MKIKFENAVFRHPIWENIPRERFPPCQFRGMIYFPDIRPEPTIRRAASRSNASGGGDANGEMLTCVYVYVRTKQEH